nr:MAG TPA: hypothetical protein [Caudoviricetes sp.]
MPTSDPNMKTTTSSGLSNTFSSLSFILFFLS